MALSLEQLEDRTSPARVWLDGAGTMRVILDGRTNSVQIVENVPLNTFTVTINGQSTVFASDPVAKVKVVGSRGNDDVTFDGVGETIDWHGGGGRDTVRFIPDVVSIGI